MKVLIISDIHVDRYESLKEIFKKQLETLFANNVFDYVLILGDITNNYLKSVKYLEYLNRYIPTRAILGNHDLYHTNVDIIKVLEDFKNYEICLTSNPIENVETNSIIVGNIGWHDYTCYQGKYYQEDLDNLDFKRINRGDYSNSDITSIIKTEMQLLLLRSQQIGYDNIIPVTHYAPHPDLVRGKKHPISNMFGNTYSHNLYKQFNIKQAYYGHTHERITQVIENIKYVTNSIGYLEEFKYVSITNNGKKDLEHEVILNNLCIIEI